MSVTSTLLKCMGHTEPDHSNTLLTSTHNSATREQGKQRIADREESQTVIISYLLKLAVYLSLRIKPILLQQ